MNELLLEQALYGSEGAAGYRILAKSPGFRDDWLSPAQQLCTAFGERPAGVACPACLFAQPFTTQHVAVVQVADHGRDDAGRPGTLRFRLLIVPRSLYAALEGDPFLIAEAFPPSWDANQSLPSLPWTGGPPSKRTVTLLHTVLDAPHSATLLGAAQALVDGGRVVFARSEPDTTLLRNLWALLPSSSRCQLWPATFAFGNVRAFHAAAVPTALVPTEPQWLHEDQAGDYPEGRYELNLQIAVENGNQVDLDNLLARKTRGHMIKLAAVLLVIFSIAVLLGVAVPKPDGGAAVSSAPTFDKLELPPDERFTQLTAEERTHLAQHLQEFADHLHLKDVPGGASDRELTDTLADLDAKLPATPQTLGPLRDQGKVKRQLRVLLWKHGVPDYNNRELNPSELVEKLEAHLVKERRP
jgi:hypothetical protein